METREKRPRLPNESIAYQALHTELPLSEKDEVKQAEEKLNKSPKQEEASVKADLKNREKQPKRYSGL